MKSIINLKGQSSTYYRIILAKELERSKDKQTIQTIRMSKIIYSLGGFVTGAAISSVFVFNMNDLIYAQMRRNMILPFSKLAN